MQDNKYDLIKFEDGEFSLDVNVSPTEDTVWLTANQMAILFERDVKTIRKHINNVFNEQEINRDTNTHFLRVAGVDQKVAFYSLNVLISVGYRVKSKRGVTFRIWAISIL
ncbi:MAG: virulence RhuM family protein [Anaeroplasmataceae bacterium]|nr:virulence RhuM family protein [Anaeroplasmataceae bacterium]